MKKVLHINLTNKCDFKCSSCPSYSSPCGKGFIKFYQLQKAIQNYEKYPIEVVLEGGEPFLHPHIYLFIEYISALPNVKKLTLTTNGVYIRENIDDIIRIVKRNHIHLCLEVLIHSELLEAFPDLLDVCKELVDRTQDVELLSSSFFVRYTSEEDKLSLLEKVTEKDIPLIYTEFDICKAYGRLKGTEYPLPFMPDKPVDWVVIAWDGTDFQTNQLERPEYENGLQKELEGITVKYPVFDSKNHRRLWIATLHMISEIRFEDREHMKVLEFQRGYINHNQNRYTKNMSGYYDSYADYFVAQFPNKNDALYNPFDTDDICARNLTNEFWDTVDTMKTTMFPRYFEEAKRHAMELSETIANLTVKAGISNTDFKDIFLLKGEDE